VDSQPILMATLYFLTGNGRLDYANSAYGDSIVKLTPYGSAPRSHTVRAPATPSDPDVDTLETNDADLGSGGPLLIPGSNLIIGGGKTGWMYLLDRTAMQFKQRITAGDE